MSTDAELLSQNPNLTEDDIKAYKINKGQLYKGTIAVCVAYGVFAGLLLLLTLFDARGRQVLTEDMLPFMITLIAGMFFIIILLVIQVATSKPRALQKGTYDGDVCPDYWKLEKTPNIDSTSEIPSKADSNDKYLMRYRCVPDPNVLDFTRKWSTDTTPKLISVNSTLTNSTADTNTFGQSATPSIAYKNIDSSTDTVSTQLKATAGKMYVPATSAGTTENFIRCDMLYPELMARDDAVTFPRNPNAMRCKYAEMCGIPWTGVCPQ